MNYSTVDDHLVPSGRQFRLDGVHVGRGQRHGGVVRVQIGDSAQLVVGGGGRRGHESQRGTARCQQVRVGGDGVAVQQRRQLFGRQQHPAGRVNKEAVPPNERAAPSNGAVTDRTLRPRCRHLESYFKRPKSSPVRPLSCSWYHCAQFIAEPKAARALRFSWAATSNNLALLANMTSPIKPEVHNVLLRRQSRTEPQPCVTSTKTW